MRSVLAGSTQGIGHGMLRGLAAAGANVVMHGTHQPCIFHSNFTTSVRFGVGICKQALRALGK